MCPTTNEPTTCDLTNLLKILLHYLYEKKNRKSYFVWILLIVKRLNVEQQNRIYIYNICICAYAIEKGWIRFFFSLLKLTTKQIEHFNFETATGLGEEKTEFIWGEV